MAGAYTNSVKGTKETALPRTMQELSVTSTSMSEEWSLHRGAGTAADRWFGAKRRDGILEPALLDQDARIAEGRHPAAQIEMVFAEFA